MAFEIRKAERRRARARIGIDGPAGAGKTHSGLRIARGLAPDGRIIVIDTEAGSAEMEAGKDGIPPYDVLPLSPPHSPKRYVEAIRACEESGADVIIIDSLSHAWTGTGGALDQVDRIAGSGNRFAAWRDVTPQHNALVDAMLQSPAHIIATMQEDRLIRGRSFVTASITAIVIVSGASTMYFIIDFAHALHVVVNNGNYGS